MDLYVAFDYHSTNLPFGFDFGTESSVYVRDRVAGTTQRLITPTFNEFASAPSISSDGRYVALQYREGFARRVLDDVGVFDRATGEFQAVNLRPDGSLPPDESLFEPSVSDDGRFVLFRSESSDLLGSGRDVNGVPDLFVRDRILGVTDCASVGTGPTEAPDHGGVLVGTLSPDGTRALFVSGASTLVAGDDNDVADVFVREPVAGRGAVDYFPDGVRVAAVRGPAPALRRQPVRRGGAESAPSGRAVRAVDAAVR